MTENIKLIFHPIVTPLSVNHCTAFNDLRLEAQKSDGKYCGTPNQSDHGITDSQWLHIIQDTKNHGIFGVFAARRLVGYIAASRWRNDINGQTALWHSGYITPEYRGRGLARHLSLAMEAWTRGKAQFKQAIFCIREDNERSIAIFAKQAQLTHIESRQWTDGKTISARWYKVELRP